MKIHELDKEILLEIIELQKHIIEGKEIKDIFSIYMNDFRTKIGADIIAICAKENEQVDFKYILEEKRLFVQMIKHFFPGRKQLSWNGFVKHCHTQFPEEADYLHIHNFHEVFNEFISKKNSDNITKGMNMRDTVIMPIYTKDNKERLGFVFYIFQSNSAEVELHKLKMATMLFQNILQPLYDMEHYTLYSKCVRINNKMSLLTSQEKKIVRQVLNGYTYSEIAETMNISINTMKTHMKNIFNKYAVNSKIELFKKLQLNT